MTRRISRAPWQAPRPVPRKEEIDPKLRRQVRDRAKGCCELCAQPLGPVFQCHHRKLRSRGGQDSICNLVALDGRCHNRVHGHPAWATENGWMVASTDDPATVPVALHDRAWRLLSRSGTYVDLESGEQVSA